jgi:N-ethylmaleimide reductase
MTSLFDEVRLGRATLANRMVMAPLTRNRADREGIPGPLAATYYAQRATAGLIVTEGMQPSAIAQGYVNTPGIHTPSQIGAWRRVTDAVHAAGGRIYAQLMHTGRIGHPDLVRHSSVPRGLLPLAPSAVRPSGTAKTYDGPREFVTPRAMTASDIAETIRDFAAAAGNAIQAGFDGVELHGGSGLLLHQFLCGHCNRRTDEYGGTINGRIRFVAAVTAAVAAAVGPWRVGLRVSPGNTFNDISEPDAARLYPVLARITGELGICYLHVYETGNRRVTLDIRAAWPGSFMLNPHADDRRTPASRAAAQQILADGTADLVSFGRLFISNPDLPARFRAGLPLTAPDPATFYGGDHRGYTDYPALVPAAAVPGSAPGLARLEQG